MFLPIRVHSDDIATAIQDSDLPTREVIAILMDSATGALDLDGLCQLHDRLAEAITELETEERQHEDVFTAAPVEFYRGLTYPAFREAQ